MWLRLVHLLIPVGREDGQGNANEELPELVIFLLVEVEEAAWSVHVQTWVTSPNPKV